MATVENLKYLVRWCLFCKHRHKHFTEPLSSASFSPGTHFQRVIPETGPAAQNPANVKRIVFCTGKVYYEINRERKARGMEDSVAIVRIEQVW